MAISIDDAPSAEPSSDFPTEDDCGPCPRIPRGAALGGTIVLALALGLIGFLIGRARARRAGS